MYGGLDAGKGATFIFENRQGFDVNIDKIECTDEGACQGTTFIMGQGVFIDAFNCANNACYGCRIKLTMYSPALPCDPSQI